MPYTAQQHLTGNPVAGTAAGICHKDISVTYDQNAFPVPGMQKFDRQSFRFNAVFVMKHRQLGKQLLRRRSKGGNIQLKIAQVRCMYIGKGDNWLTGPLIIGNDAGHARPDKKQGGQPQQNQDACQAA